MAKCKTCDGTGLVWTDLRSYRFGEGFTKFMTAGLKPHCREDGSTWYEVVCHHCDGKGKRPEIKEEVSACTLDRRLLGAPPGRVDRG